MPMLPSGRHIAITLAPFCALYAPIDESDPVDLNQVLAIESIGGLYPYTEVIYLTPPEHPITPGTGSGGGENPLAVPEGMTEIRTGLRLSDWDLLTKDWTEEDKTAFREFLGGRALGLFQSGMEEVERVRKICKKRKQKLWDDTIAIMRKFQEERWVENIDTAEWDDYDMLAALRVVVATISSQPDLRAKHWQTVDRLFGMWSVIGGRRAFLQQPIVSGDDPSELALTWRTEGKLDDSPDDRPWLHQQLVIECVNLWNHAGETLEEACPDAYGILTLVTMSPEGTAAA